MFNTVVIIGAGPVGRALAARANLPVLISSSRGPDPLADVIAELAPGASATTVERAAQTERRPVLAALDRHPRQVTAAGPEG